ncbi:Mu-like prophage major head subunit gpT family protein [Pseudomonas citronellolis]|uniref:Mu-like prophage major head subunit gpT family protein n=1 Tax=Pseudomonas citronellolis TaxID=53408 RepID=UPI000778B06A|nr:Mu-like prophage major head subunit gpT family protein [Pseudomonas citronellolis]AMO73842.1 Mu-like prophage major head subunit gpT [Pseudomonas citronellolis]
MPTIITPAVLGPLFKGYRAEFQQALSDNQAQAKWQRVATRIPSVSASNLYAWLGQFPMLREWVGARVVKQMAAGGYEVANKLFEGTVSVPRVAIEDDQAGVYLPLFEEMGRAAAYHPDSLVFEALKAGMTSACYDGQNFFDTEHPVFPEVDGTGTATLVSNLDIPRTDPGPTWYLLDVSRAIKPILFQERTTPELTSKTNPNNSDAVFDEDVFVHGIRYRCNAGFGLWQMAYASQQPLTGEFYGNARAAMGEFKADGGRPLNIVPNLLVVPPRLEAAARKLLKKDQDGGNEWAGTAELFVCSELA